jgi:hypothetical protein
MLFETRGIMNTVFLAKCVYSALQFKESMSCGPGSDFTPQG